MKKEDVKAVYNVRASTVSMSRRDLTLRPQGAIFYRISGKKAKF